jgi:hypothetical protein
MIPLQTHISLLIDKTGSMHPYADQVVDGLNYYTKQLCAQAPGPVFATLQTFAETVTTEYQQRPIHRVDKLRLESYIPYGNTALYDAITTTLEALSVASPQRQILIILSDGEDVCSMTTLTDCAAAITKAQSGGVLVVFLGDGPEALETAALLGIPAMCRYRFTARDGLRGVFQMLTTQTVQALTAVATKGLLPTQFFPN